MIQRQQTLWLILATAAAVASFIFPFAVGDQPVSYTHLFNGLLVSACTTTPFTSSLAPVPGPLFALAIKVPSKQMESISSFCFIVTGLNGY